MFNIYDQANKVTYPDYKSGYWQRQVTPAELPARDIYTYFTTNFGAELDSINQWTPDDRVGGLFLFGDTLYLARVHDGGRDSRGRPQRWTLLVWREDNVPGGKRRALDLARWLADPQWPADSAPVALPWPVPATRYSVPFATATPFDDSIFPTGGRIDEVLASAAEAQDLWVSWSSAPVPRRAENGFLIFAAVGGAFKCLHELSLGESETHKTEVAAEKRRREEAERRRLEKEERLRREQEEEDRRLRHEAEKKRQREEEILRRKKAKHRRWLRTQMHFVINVFLVLLSLLALAFVAWDYQEGHPEIREFLEKYFPIPGSKSTSPAKSAPSIPKTGKTQHSGYSFEPPEIHFPEPQIAPLPPPGKPAPLASPETLPAEQRRPPETFENINEVKDIEQPLAPKTTEGGKGK